MTVRDFNQLAIRRHAVDPKLRDEEDEAYTVTDATVMEPAGSGVFKDPVTTSLPYTERVLVLFQEGQESWDEVIPTEDTLVLATGVSANGSLARAWYRSVLIVSSAADMEFTFSVLHPVDLNLYMQVHEMRDKRSHGNTECHSAKISP